MSYVSHVDPCSARVLVAMLRKGWVPIKSEFSIFDEHTRIATSIDCIAWDVVRRTGVVIEIKTGHESQTNYEATTGKTKFLPPLERIPDSPLNRAAVQLGVTLIILLRRYNIHFEQAAVIRPRSRNKDVQVYNLPKWIMLPGLQRKMYGRLKETTGIHVERRFFKRTGSQKQRAQLDLQEAAQKEIEVGPDPKETVVWQPRSFANPEIPEIPEISSRPIKKEPRESDPEPEPKTARQEVRDLYEELSTSISPKVSDSASETDEEKPAKPTRKRKRKGVEPIPRAKKRARSLKISVMETSWHQTLQTMGYV